MRLCIPKSKVDEKVGRSCVFSRSDTVHSRFKKDFGSGQKVF